MLDCLSSEQVLKRQHGTAGFTRAHRRQVERAGVSSFEPGGAELMRHRRVLALNLHIKQHVPEFVRNIRNRFRFWFRCSDVGN